MQQISFNAPHQVDQIYLRAVDELPPCPPLKSPNLVFRVKITVLYQPFFFKKNVISQVLALSRDKKWPFFYKKHQIFILRLVCIIFVFYARRTGTLLFPGRSHALYYIILYYIILYYIILNYILTHLVE